MDRPSSSSDCSEASAERSAASADLVAAAPASPASRLARLASNLAAHSDHDRQRECAAGDEVGDGLRLHSSGAFEVRETHGLEPQRQAAAVPAVGESILRHANDAKAERQHGNGRAPMSRPPILSSPRLGYTSMRSTRFGHAASLKIETSKVASCSGKTVSTLGEPASHQLASGEAGHA